MLAFAPGAVGLARGSGAAEQRPAWPGVGAIERSGTPREGRVQGGRRPVNGRRPQIPFSLTSSARAIAAINARTRIPSECIEKVHNVLLLLRTQCSEGLRCRLALSVMQGDRSRDVRRTAIV